MDAYGPDPDTADWGVKLYDGDELVPRFYRVSDHRPVVAVVDF